MQATTNTAVATKLVPVFIDTNVGGQIKASVQLVSVYQIGGRWIIVEDHTTGQKEEYDGQRLFAQTYGLD